MNPPALNENPIPVRKFEKAARTATRRADGLFPFGQTSGGRLATVGGGVRAKTPKKNAAEGGNSSPNADGRHERMQASQRPPRAKRLPAYEPANPIVTSPVTEKNYSALHSQPRSVYSKKKTPNGAHDGTWLSKRISKRIQITHFLPLFAMTTFLAACQTISSTPSSQPSDNFTTISDNQTQPSPDYWQLITLPLHAQQQIANGDSFTLIVPRTDLDLESEMGPIPISAGIASHFYFFRCTCGKTKLLGDFTACDYESDDVIDALRAGHFTIVSVAPLLTGTRPNLVSIRFQAEGDADDLVKTLAAALKEAGRPDHPHPKPSAP
jgi:hypothetical protein